MGMVRIVTPKDNITVNGSVGDLDDVIVISENDRRFESLTEMVQDYYYRDLVIPKDNSTENGKALIHQIVNYHETGSIVDKQMPLASKILNKIKGELIK